MGQIFHPSTNTIAKVSILGSLFIVAGIVWAVSAMNRSPYVTQVGVAIEQPVPFSHKHHVDGLGIDCRFCHTSVETSSFAGIPPTSTCMKCHSIIWADSPMLEPVRESARTGRPIEWMRVHDLPDHVYFDHSIHVAKGVSCLSCHGQVDQMPLTWRTGTLHMRWCLDCHRHPEPSVGTPEGVFSMETGPRPAPQPDRPIRKIVNCSACHR